MADFTVLAVKGHQQWDGTHGPMLSYTLTVRGPEGRELDCEINKKPDSRPPAVGDTIDGTLKASDNPAFLPKLKANFGGGGKGGGNWSPRDPAERREIAMQAAQKCAVTILEVAASHGDYKPTTAGETASQVKTIAHMLWQQVQAAGNADPGMVHGLPVRNEPVKTGAPDVAPEPYAPEVHPDAGDVPWEASA